MKTEITLKANQSDIVEVLLQDVRTDLQAKADVLAVTIYDTLEALKEDKQVFEDGIEQIMVNSIPQKFQDIISLMGTKPKPNYPKRVFLIAGDNAHLPPIGSEHKQRTGQMINLIDYVQSHLGYRRGHNNTSITINAAHVQVVTQLIIQNEKDSKAHDMGLDISVVYKLPITVTDSNTNTEYALSQFVNEGGISKLSKDNKAVCKQLKTVFGEPLFTGLLEFKKRWNDIGEMVSEHVKISQSIWDADNRPGKFKAQFTKASLQKSAEGKEILKVIGELKDANSQSLLTS